MQRSASIPSAKSSQPLDAIYGPIEEPLAEMEALLADEMCSASPAVQKLINHVGRFQGKRLRPALVLLAGRIAGVLSPVHPKLAAIIELIHTATLVHDDVLDEADQRRNVKSLNRLAGNEVSVLLGDYIYAKAFALSTSLDDQTASRVLAQVTQTVCRGEIEQVYARNEFDLSEERYLKIIEQKTAVLYAAAARLGAWYAGGAPDVIAAVEAYGLNLGIAFQMIDDCLDLTGEESVVGKSLGTDIEKGKMTLPLIRLSGSLPAGDRDKLLGILQNDGLQDRRGLLWSQFDLGAAVAAAQHRADDYVRASLAAIEPLNASASLRSLKLIARYVLERDR